MNPTPEPTVPHTGAIALEDHRTMNRRAQTSSLQCLLCYSARLRSILTLLVAYGILAVPGSARASLFEGETLDKVAEAMSWVVIVIVPIVCIVVFWLVHILPEKIAEKRHHPQAKAIQCLCLLSLFFGGLLWPIAWLWAYSKPVLHKLAYGHDKEDHHGEPVPPAGDPPKEDPPGKNQPAAASAAPVETSAKKKGGHA